MSEGNRKERPATSSGGELLKRQNVDVALLSETHIEPSDVHRMQNKHYRAVASPGDGSKNKGVMILIKHKLNLATDKISCLRPHQK